MDIKKPGQCKGCPFPPGTVCESAVPCAYNPLHSRIAKLLLKPFKKKKPENDNAL